MSCCVDTTIKMTNEIYTKWLVIEDTYDFNITRRYIDEFGMIGLQIAFGSDRLDSYKAYLAFCNDINSDENICSEDFDAIDVLDGYTSDSHGGGDWLYTTTQVEDGSFKKVDINKDAFIIDVKLSIEDMQDEFQHYMSKYREDNGD